MISEYITNRQGRVAEYEGKLASHVGGKDNLDVLLQWAGLNYTEKQVERFNAAVSNMKDPDGAFEALDMLRMRYEGVHGRQGASVTQKTETVHTAGIEPIEDMKELVALQSDPRYKKGIKSYHDMVNKRLAASPHLFG